MKTKRFGMSVVVVSIIITMVACNGEVNGEGEDDDMDAGQDREVDLRFSWWGTTAHHDTYLEVIDLFEEKYPHISIEPDYTGWAGYWEQMGVQASAGNLPDIVTMSTNYLLEYVANDLLYPLDDYVGEGEVIDVSDVTPAFLGNATIDGTYYALPIGVNSSMLVADSEWFDEAGIEIPEPGYTWEDYLEMAEEFGAQMGDNEYVVALDQWDPTYPPLRLWLNQHDQDIYNDDLTGVDFEVETVVEFLEMWQPLREEGVFAPAEVYMESQQSNEDRLYMQDRSPIDFFQTSQIGMVEQLSGKDSEMLVLPQHEDSNFAGVFAMGMMHAVSATSEHPYEAAKFIDFWNRSEEANELIAGMRGMPIYPEIQDFVYDLVDERDRRVFDFLDLYEEEGASYLPAQPEAFTQIDDLITALFEQYKYGNITAEELAQDFKDGGNEILAP